MPAITQAEVQEFADIWYKKLDVHAPLEDFRPMIASEGFRMIVPEATLVGWNKFSDWYIGGNDLPGVINIFFDEVHELKSVVTTPTQNETATVKVVVKWQASAWNAPDPKSKRIVLDAYQTWEMIRSSQSGRLCILTYTVDEMKLYEGSASL
jgi:hypothetical protein